MIRSRRLLQLGISIVWSIDFIWFFAHAEGG
jgi:hypothetical protein